MRLTLALLFVIACSLAGWAIHDDFWVQRPALAAERTTVANWAQAQDASAKAANAKDKACAAAVQAAVRSGAAISRASRVVTPAKPGEEQPMVGNDVLRNMVGQDR